MPRVLRDRRVRDEESRWRDRAGIVHLMVRRDTGRGVLGSRWWTTVCGAHAATIVFPHKKYCPLKATCLPCLGLA